MITRTRRRPREPELPLSLPQVEASADNNGTFEVTIDGLPYEQGTPLGRAELPQAIRSIAGQLASPVRVRIREQDGTQFTDIVTPASDATCDDTTESAPEPVVGEGFVPGEQIAVAVVVAYRAARVDGTTGLSLPSGLLSQHREVVLMGHTSGTVLVVGEHT